MIELLLTYGVEVIPYIILALGVLYLWFRCAMWYLRNKHRRPITMGWERVLLEALLAPGLLLDVIVNWTVGTSLGVVFVWTLSEKLVYIRTHPKYGFYWQHRFADFLCRELNKWDPTHHHC